MCLSGDGGYFIRRSCWVYWKHGNSEMKLVGLKLLGNTTDMKRSANVLFLQRFERALLFFNMKKSGFCSTRRQNKLFAFRLILIVFFITFFSIKVGGSAMNGRLCSAVAYFRIEGTRLLERAATFEGKVLNRV